MLCNIATCDLKFWVRSRLLSGSYEYWFWTHKGSFHNPLPSAITSGVKATVKRGMAALLADSTNISTTDSCKRACKVRAEQKIHVQQAKCSPRGNPTAAAAARFTMEPDVSPTTPYRMFHYHRATFSAGLDCITSYMRRNSSMKVQKAITITLIGTAMPLF